jgi:hypothetical protein
MKTEAVGSNPKSHLLLPRVVPKTGTALHDAALLKGLGLLWRS